MTSKVINDPIFSGLTPLPTIEAAEPHFAALDLFKISVASFLSETLNVSLDAAYESVETGKKQGDFVVAVPRFRLKGKPAEIATEAASKFKENVYIATAEAQGAFLVFNVQTASLARVVLNQINQLTHLHPSKKPIYGSNESGNGKCATVEFSSPNIAKPFHAGHLRSTIIGMFVANLFEANGWKVHKINYLGDWGKQYGLLDVGFERYGNEEELQKDPIRHLFEVYVKVNQDVKREEKEAVENNRKERRANGETDVPPEGAEMTKQEAKLVKKTSKTDSEARHKFTLLESGDEKLLASWRRYRDLSIRKYEEIYARLNITFDEYSGESQVDPKDQDSALETLDKKGLLVEDGKARLIDLSKYKLDKPIIVKSDGAKLYLTRDIGEAMKRYRKYNFDRSIYVVASQQTQHFAQLFKICQLSSFPFADKMEHIQFGLVNGMSTRKGNVEILEDIIDYAQTKMHEQMRRNDEKYKQVENPVETSDNIGITAIKIQDMSSKLINNYDFNIDRMTSFEGDTGPYLQYAHVRLASIERKAAPAVVLPEPEKRLEQINTSLLTEPCARTILILLASYPSVVRNSFKTREPSTIVTFCFKLTHAISTALEILIVKNADNKDIALARLYLFSCAKEVLSGAMKLLTLTPLERM